MTKPTITVFGEVLFDCFPDAAPVLGGAPFNVAWHLQGFGESPRFISAVGDDEYGNKIRQAMDEWGLSTEFIEIKQGAPTGVVNVTIDNGEPHYDIRADCAYDDITLSEGILDSVGDSGFLYHGTLAMRSQTTAESLDKLVHRRGIKRFIDVNLRDPWWNPGQVIEAMNYAYCVKLNYAELVLLLAADSPDAQITEDTWQDLAGKFKAKHNVVHLLVTRGEQGAMLSDSVGEWLRVAPPSYQTRVQDTVGAGDAFASVMLLGFVNDWDLGVAMKRAQDFANYIVMQRGAITTNQATYRDFRHLWNI
ncbi:MAG: carbohydrate kinase [Ketobacteraceae bacterium]|nr:carbohydrate kinase [Ketobacteraceae bacterium]